MPTIAIAKTAKSPGRVINATPATEASTPALNAAEAAPLDAARTRVRRPFGARNQKLAYPDRPGFKRHWFNDTPGRIMQAKDAGWDHVTDDQAKHVTRPVGVNDSGSALMGFLMETPQEWYDEDMAAQQALVDETDRAIKEGAVAGTPGKDGRYVPAQGIKVGVR